MNAPYTTGEVAAAIVEESGRTGRSLGRLILTADLAAGRWVIMEESPDGRRARTVFPFASARGVYTPAEIARGFVRGTWPFD